MAIAAPRVSTRAESLAGVVSIHDMTPSKLPVVFALSDFPQAFDRGLR